MINVAVPSSVRGVGFILELESRFINGTKVRYMTRVENVGVATRTLSFGQWGSGVRPWLTPNRLRPLRLYARTSLRSKRCVCRIALHGGEAERGEVLHCVWRRPHLGRESQGRG